MPKLQVMADIRTNRKKWGKLEHEDASGIQLPDRLTPKCKEKRVSAQLSHPAREMGETADAK